jgi:hypothetical protein
VQLSEHLTARTGSAASCANTREATHAASQEKTLAEKVQSYSGSTQLDVAVRPFAQPHRAVRKENEQSTKTPL